MNSPNVPATNQVSTTSRRRVVLTAALIAVFLGSVDFSVVAAFLPSLISDLKLPLDAISSALWVITAYIVSYSISLFVMGRVSDFIGRRRAMIICMIIYLIGTVMVIGYPTTAGMLTSLYGLLGIHADIGYINLHAVILARIVAAFGAGALPSITIALVGDLYEPDQRLVPSGITAAVDTLGWLVGGAWGGQIVQSLHWTNIFVINLPVIVLALLVLLRTLPRSSSAIDHSHDYHRIDWRGIFFLSLALIALNIALSSLTSAEGTLTLATAIPALAIAFVSLIFFVRVERHQQSPIIDLTLFRDAGARAAVFVNLFVGYGLYVAIVSLPLLTIVRNMDQLYIGVLIDTLRDQALKAANAQSGLLLGGFGIPLAVASVLGGWIGQKIGVRRLTALGLLLAIVSFIILFARLRSRRIPHFRHDSSAVDRL